MTDFVDRLLGRTGFPGIAPAIPTLFEPLSTPRSEDPLPSGVFTTSTSSPDVAATRPVVPSSVPVVAHAPQPQPIAPSVPTLAASAPLAVAAHAMRVETERHIEATVDRLRDPVAAVRELSTTLVREQVSVPAACPTPVATTETLTNRVHTQHVSQKPSEAPTRSRPPIRQRVGAVREPDVHITIGRVEITATPPAAAPKQRADASKRPILSLDDYLRDRAGGDRR